MISQLRVCHTVNRFRNFYSWRNVQAIEQRTLSAPTKNRRRLRQLEGDSKRLTLGNSLMRRRNSLTAWIDIPLLSYFESGNRRRNTTATLGAATPTRGLMPTLICLDQPPAGGFGADASQAMHGAIPGSKVSNEVCANCQITTMMLKTQRTKTRISRRVRPFSCERTSIL